MTVDEFTELRYGMFIHYGLFSLLERGEWVMNREKIPREQMKALAEEFNPTAFDADAIADIAVASGMKYIVFTTMHHEGFRLYETERSDFNAKAICGRDLTAEVIAAARARGLKIGLYHSLNNWYDLPGSCTALEDPAAYNVFIENTFARIEELVSRYTPFDILWYDGWWPFHAEGWQSKRMNEQIRAIQPDLLFNGRNGLPGDFGTPEKHLTPPDPWRPWEACMTLNDHWGYHRGDTNWKSPVDLLRMLLKCGAEKGNLLLNIGPRGDGSIPEESVAILKKVGQWLREGGAEAITQTDPMTFGAHFRKPDERTDWDSAGIFTASGNTFFMTLLYNPGTQLTLTGLEMSVEAIDVAGFGPLTFTQHDDRLTVDLPETLSDRFCPVLRMACDRPPSIYRTGGMRVPNVEHPGYDPLPSDIIY